MGIELETMKKYSQVGYKMSLGAHLLLCEPISRHSPKSSICDLLISLFNCKLEMFNLPHNLSNDIEYEIANVTRIHSNH